MVWLVLKWIQGSGMVLNWLWRKWNPHCRSWATLQGQWHCPMLSCFAPDLKRSPCSPVLLTSQPLPSALKLLCAVKWWLLLANQPVPVQCMRNSLMVSVSTDATRWDHALGKAFIGIASILKHSLSTVKFLMREHLTKTIQHRGMINYFCYELGMTAHVTSGRAKQSHKSVMHGHP